MVSHVAELADLRIGDRVTYNARTGTNYALRGYHGRTGTVVAINPAHPHFPHFPVEVTFDHLPGAGPRPCHPDELTVIQAGESRG